MKGKPFEIYAKVYCICTYSETSDKVRTFFFLKLDNLFWGHFWLWFDSWNSILRRRKNKGFWGTRSLSLSVLGDHWPIFFSWNLWASWYISVASALALIIRVAMMIAGGILLIPHRHWTRHSCVGKHHWIRHDKRSTVSKVSYLICHLFLFYLIFLASKFSRQISQFISKHSIVILFLGLFSVPFSHLIFKGLLSKIR